MSQWIWYFGEFEHYHSLKLHSRRVERELPYPAFWAQGDKTSNVTFQTYFELEKDEDFTIYVNGMGYWSDNGKKLPFDVKRTLSKGGHYIECKVCNLSGIPALYVESETAPSVPNGKWKASLNYVDFLPCASNPLCTDRTKSPDSFPFAYTDIEPISKQTVNGGVLYTYDKETFARLYFDGDTMPESGEIIVYYGETDTEALDIEYCYNLERFNKDKLSMPECKAFKSIFVTGENCENVKFRTEYEYLPYTKTGSFSCSDPILTKMWDTAAYTFELNSREFYLDGIKRDRWCWSGDAYQSYFTNRYLGFDDDIERRSIIALGGKGEIAKHINTILDYTYYWIMSVMDYYEMTGDIDFVKNVYPRMEEYCNFCLSRLDGNGLASGMPNDWVFVDWADMDKTGANCAEQLLFLRCMEVMYDCSVLTGKTNETYKAKAEDLKKKITALYWDTEKGAFIDSFESGKRNVTRHPNIFALLYGYATKEQADSIVKNVILNDEVTQLKTPYFKFFELDALCRLGMYDEVLKRINEYWGQQIDAGATTFWEEFTPGVDPALQLGMYGDKYGKSLCHAWGSSPIYLLGRYYLGVYPTSAGYETFNVEPNLNFDCFKTLNAVVPVNVNGGKVTFTRACGDNEVTIVSNVAGGTVIVGNEKISLIPNEEVKVRVID